jgi:Holliday junction resolvase RusA-like endonuclease
MTTTFFVPGTPVAKGSAKAFYNKKVARAFVVQDNAGKQKPWASLISFTAQEAGCVLLDGPVSLSMEFRMPRPKAHYGTAKSGPALKGNAPKWHTSRPDADKLTRCVMDALTGVAYRDDSQVCSKTVDKYYDDRPGVWICVKQLTDTGC